MKAYRVTIGALSYIALAPSSCQAIINAMLQHPGAHAISARPLRPRPAPHGGTA